MGRSLAALRATARHGSNGVVLVSGAAGIGKTAVLSETVRQAVTLGYRVVAGRCDLIEEVRPGAPLVAALRSGSDPLVSARECAEITTLAGDALLLADRIATHLEKAATTGPLLVVIDDLQWADRVSGFVLRSLIPHLVGLPVVWLLASRSVDSFRDLVGHWQIRVERLQLAPLGAADITALAMDRLGSFPDERTRRMLATADGNPFLAGQVLDLLTRSADDPDVVPIEFTAAIAARVARLPEPARVLVHLVAVSGRPLSLRDASALLGDGTDLDTAVPDAIGSGLVSASGDELAFHHDLVREAVLDTMADGLEAGLHRRFAAHFLGAPSGSLLAAAHARASAVPGDLDAARVLLAAAETLVTASVDEAGELAALAYRTVSPARPEWLELSLRCLAVLGRGDRAGEAIAVADTILARTEDPAAVGAAETEAASALWLSGRLVELAGRTDRALARDGLDAAYRARLSSARALADTRLGRGDQALGAAERALECARAAGDSEAIGLALRAAGEAARNQARHAVALSYFRELRTVARVDCLPEEITALQFLDRYDHADLLLKQACSDGDATRRAALPGLLCAQLWQDFNLGRLDDADAGARALLDLSRQFGDTVYTLDAIIVRTGVLLMRGQSEQAAAQLRQADRLTGMDDGLRRLGLSVINGWFAAAGGDLDTAVDTVLPVAEGADAAHGYWPLWPCWNGLLFEIAMAAGAESFAEACVELAETAAARNPGVASFEGVALNTRGRMTSDLDMIAASADTLAQSPRPILRALGGASYGEALLAQGERASGLARLDQAWDEYHRMGAIALRDQTERAMRKAGARFAKWKPAAAKAAMGWAALTDSERRVAVLIGAGHTNKAAATELGVSVNTVGTHLRSVFTKLGIQSRVQLANSLHRQERSG